MKLNIISSLFFFSRFVILPLSIISHCFPVPFIGLSYRHSCLFLFLSFKLKKIYYYLLPALELFKPLPKFFLTLFVSQICIAFLVCCHAKELRRFPTYHQRSTTNGRDSSKQDSNWILFIDYVGLRFNCRCSQQYSSKKKRRIIDKK